MVHWLELFNLRIVEVETLHSSTKNAEAADNRYGVTAYLQLQCTNTLYSPAAVPGCALDGNMMGFMTERSTAWPTLAA